MLDGLDHSSTQFNQTKSTASKFKQTLDLTNEAIKTARISLESSMKEQANYF